MHELLKIQNLYFSYADHLVLDGLSLSVPQGEILCIKGANGTGKTTLLKILADLIICPTMSIKLESKDCSQELLRDNLMFVATEPVFYETLNGAESIKLVKVLWHQDDTYIERALHFAHILNIERELNKPISTYSQGMKYKLYFLQFLAVNRKLILLDEPLNYMDFDSRKNAIELIKSYVARNQGACVFSSHIEDTIDKLATRTLVLRNGQLYDK